MYRKVKSFAAAGGLKPPPLLSYLQLSYKIKAKKRAQKQEAGEEKTFFRDFNTRLNGAGCQYSLFSDTVCFVYLL